MQCKRYEDFMREYQYYRSFLWKYRKTGRAFKDFYFHPKLKIKETKVKIDWSKIEWKRVDEVYKAPLFDPKLINIDYIKQGKLGDCYFISALLRVAKQSDLVAKLFDRTPDTILGRVKNSINIKCGAVVIFFHAFGRETPVLIDTYLPFYKGTSTLAFSHPSNIHVSPWFCLVEKAYAKLFGSYSNISGGNFTHSIYSLFGYQPRFITISSLKQEQKVTKKTPFQRLLEYQHQGGVMSADIDQNSKSSNELKTVGLVSHHSYLLLKVVEFKGKHFFNLRNPWGSFEWKGDWSDNSPLWSKEYREGLNHKKNSNDGAFWMIEKDFLNYFTSVDISRPIPTDWHSKTFSLEMWPGHSDGCKVECEQVHLEKRPNYALKINEKVPAGKKVDLFLLFERRSYFPDEVKFVNHKQGKYVFLFVQSKGQKLTQTVLKHSNRFYLSLNNDISSYKYTINDPGEILTFAVQRTEKSDVFDECSIRVTCKYGFVLYEIGKPKETIDDNDNTGKIFTTVTGVHKLIMNNRNKGTDKRFMKKNDDDDDDKKSFYKPRDDKKKRGKSVDEKDIKRRSRSDMFAYKKDPQKFKKDEAFNHKRDDRNDKKYKKDDKDDDRNDKKYKKDDKDDDRNDRKYKKDDKDDDRNDKKYKKDDKNDKKYRRDDKDDKKRRRDDKDDDDDKRRKDDPKEDNKKRKPIRPKYRKVLSSEDDDRKDSDKSSNDDDHEGNESEKAKMKKKEEDINRERFRIQREVNEKADEQMRLRDEINEIEDQIDGEEDEKKIAQLSKKLDQKRNQMEELEDQIMLMLYQLDEKDSEKSMNEQEGKNKKEEKPKPDSKPKSPPHDDVDKPKQTDKKDVKNKPNKRRKSVPKPKVKLINID